MLRHTDDAYATMLLMSQISPSREELVRPLSGAEWHALHARAREAGLGGLGALMNMDMSGMMMRLGITESEAYRLCVLMGRMLPLSMSMEKFAERDIDIVTIDERAYPERLRERLGVKAPPQIYLAGRHELFKQHAVAVLGPRPAREGAEELARGIARLAVEAGYVLITDGAPGLGRVAEDEAVKRGGKVLEIVADALSGRAADEDFAQMLLSRAGAAVSLVHPDAPYTKSHAQLRNKCIYALSDAVFVLACSEGKGSTWDGACEALRNHYCDFLYSWNTPLYDGNAPLLLKGATAIPDMREDGFQKLAAVWRSAGAEQLCLFDRAEPRG